MTSRTSTVKRTATKAPKASPPPAPKSTPAPASTVPAGPHIVFRGQRMPVREPNEAQLTLLISAERFYMQVPKMMGRIADLPEDTPPDDPRMVEATKVVTAGKKHVARLGDIIASLFVDESDWEWIEQGMASREIDWREIIEIPTMIMKAARGEPANRADKRAASRGKAVRA